MKTKLKLLILVLVVLTPHFLKAQSWGYDNNRFAISADGNNQPDNMHSWSTADPDDWGGTPTALAIVAKLNLQDKLVHYSYNNFIASPPHTTATNEMKLGIDGGIKLWGFDKSRFFDVPVDNSAALIHLAGEIKKSTQADPLYFIHMGPAEFFYRAVKLVVEEGKVEALSHVYVVSHSGYNDNHLRRGDPKFDKLPVSAVDKHHTMVETIALSRKRIKYKKIIDQNGGWDANLLWKSDKDWTVWHWMRDHKDPSVRFIYERMLANAKNSADVSDAGMLYYLLVGDENGSPSKFKAFIGDGINEIPVKP